MYPKRTIGLLFLFLSTQFLFAQPLPCEEPPTMTSFCEDACIICDIDGFTGRHESSVIGEAPPDFCTIVVHNAQWIAFIAGSEDLEVQLSVSNCRDDVGLEFAIYEAVDCQFYNMVSNCLGGFDYIPNGTSGTISNTEPLVIGQYYYIVMDGAIGDNCDWTFSVLEGSTEVDPLTTSGAIQGDQMVCPEVEQQYFIEPLTGATEFEWTVDGVVEGDNAPVLNYEFQGTGTFNVCVTASNACDEASPSCIQVLSEIPPVTEIVEILCEGDSIEVAGQVFSESGNYQIDLISEQGCDSLIMIQLTELVTPLLQLDVNICEGDTIYIGDNPYFNTGVYQETLLSSQQCDSIVNLDLTTIICNINSSDLSIPVRCQGESSGQIDFAVVNGTAPFNYTWESLDGLFSGLGNIPALNTTQTINAVPAGTYLININDNFGNVDVIIVEVEEPDELSLSLQASDYNGLNLTCADSDDGTLNANPSGGVPNYTYNWSIGGALEMIDNLAPGTYAVTVTDEMGCTVEGSSTLLAPAPILLIGEFKDPDCSGLSSGTVTAVQALGGTGTYTYSLDGFDFSDEQVFDNLSEGTYTLTVRDENACEDELTETIIAPQIPDINFDENLEISLGEVVTLEPAINNINIDTLRWTSSELITCSDCPVQEVMPLNDAIYTLAVTSIDGCTDEESIRVQVNKFRNIYVPNVFSPNFDGFNDYFTVYGGQEVALIKRMRVYNRWGALMYEGNNLESGIEGNGWDGTFKGKDLEPGVFAWTAEILFIDGQVLSYSGDIMIAK